MTKSGLHDKKRKKNVKTIILSLLTTLWQSIVVIKSITDFPHFKTIHLTKYSLVIATISTFVQLIYIFKYEAIANSNIWSKVKLHTCISLFTFLILCISTSLILTHFSSKTNQMIAYIFNERENAKSHFTNNIYTINSYAHYNFSIWK